MQTHLPVTSSGEPFVCLTWKECPSANKNKHSLRLTNSKLERQEKAQLGSLSFSEEMTYMNQIERKGIIQERLRRAQEKVKEKEEMNKKPDWTALGIADMDSPKKNCFTSI
eukprot:TRINITY_DN3197_c0_g1_i1.p1 TRINITY_DN3197_c0_g1~~TRINITY_DN3197_c0_g1_i1.p1  ORF type:complete len:111 (-),score=25.05 TRINITY_DN3197_c0_g1_i1:290-622(-)